MSQTTVLMFHSRYLPSRANTALLAAANRLPGVEGVDMQQRYADGQLDVDREVARLLDTDRLVLQFPIQWYSTPPLLQSWQDQVLTRLFYLAYQEEGRHFEGTPLMLAVTAGNTPDAYQPEGQNGFPLSTLLTPLQATARRCGLPWSEPFVLYQADRLSDEELALACQSYVQQIQVWQTQTALTGEA